MPCRKCEKQKMSSPTLYITCYCGLARLLPDTVKGVDGEKVDLPACPRCGAVISGFYSDGKLVLVSEIED
jgi:hypothetical protein